MNTRRILLTSFAIVVLLITWQDVQCSKEAGQLEMPWPPRLIAAGIVFGLVDVAAAVIGDAAALVGAGYVLAMLICTVCPHKNGKSECSGCNTAGFQSNCRATTSAATVQPSQQATLQNAPNATGPVQAL